ncbi:MAG: PQQ-dependent sugar dehydrogenase [Hyphomicrobiales bacterium]
MIRLCSFILILFGFAFPVQANPFPSKDYELKIEVLSSKLDTPWALAFLPDASILITERDGNLRLFKDGALSKPLSGVPKVWARGQGGLLDVAIDPNFAENRWVYLSFSEAGEGGSGTAVARGQLNGLELQNTKVIYRQNIKTGTGRHFGSRLVFARDGTLFITHGDRGKRPRSQDPFDHAGSIIRINPDGTIPADNPFADGKKALPEIWSIGHRNAQGITIHPETGDIWTSEHGARGGDEINQPKAGKNYGWPIISYGRHYSGLKIGTGVARDGLEQPHFFWDPSIAPSSILFYQGDMFPQWKGDIFVGALGGELISRLSENDGQVAETERFLEGDVGRVRDIAEGPNGALYLITNSDSGYLLRVTPSN